MTIKNPNYDPSLISKIRNICIKNFNKIKILWTPSHVGIEGNEQADKVAAEAKKINSYHNNYISNKWDGYQHNYKRFNPTGVKLLYPKSSPRNVAKLIVRLRIGQAKFLIKIY